MVLRGNIPKINLDGMGKMGWTWRKMWCNGIEYDMRVIYVYEHVKEVNDNKQKCARP